MAVKKATVSMGKKRRVVKRARKPAFQSGAYTAFTGEDLIAYLGAGESGMLEKCLSLAEE